MADIVFCSLRHTIPANTSISVHKHPYWQLDWLTEGAVTASCAGERIRQRAGEVLIIRPNVMHSLAYGPLSRNSGLKFSLSSLHTIPRDVILFRPAADEYRALLRVYGAYSGNHANARLIAGHYLDIFLLSFVFTMKQKVKVWDAAIERAIAVIRENLKNRVNDQTLADRAGLSYNYFIARFKNYTGYSPAEYIRMLRMKRAQSLLMETRKPIGAIAVEVGYTDVYAFGKAFKRISGFSPGYYRRLHY